MANSISIDRFWKRSIKIQHHLTQSLAPHTPLVLLGLTGDEGLSCECCAESVSKFPSPFCCAENGWLCMARKHGCLHHNWILRDWIIIIDLEKCWTEIPLCKLLLFGWYHLTIIWLDHILSAGPGEDQASKTSFCNHRCYQPIELSWCKPCNLWESFLIKNQIEFSLVSPHNFLLMFQCCNQARTIDKIILPVAPHENLLEQVLEITFCKRSCVMSRSLSFPLNLCATA